MCKARLLCQELLGFWLARLVGADDKGVYRSGQLLFCPSTAHSVNLLKMIKTVSSGRLMVLSTPTAAAAMRHHHLLWLRPTWACCFWACSSRPSILRGMGATKCCSSFTASLLLIAWLAWWPVVPRQQYTVNFQCFSISGQPKQNTLLAYPNRIKANLKRMPYLRNRIKANTKRIP